MKRKYNKRILKQLLIEYIDQHHYIPTERQIDADKTMPSAHTFQIHFGSWYNALRAVGCRFNKYDPYKRERAGAILHMAFVRRHSPRIVCEDIFTMYDTPQECLIKCPV